MSCAEGEPSPLPSVREATAAAQLALEAAGIEDARFEAQLLIALALGVSRTAVLAGAPPPPNQSQQREIEHLIHLRACERVPLAYLRGSQEFYGLPFFVNSSVLIPRPETELLVEFAVKCLSECLVGGSVDPLLVDVGSGSGCIAIAALHTVKPSRGICVDLSGDAINTALKNARANHVADRLRFIRSGLLSGLRGRVSVIVSNPPYIPSREIDGLQPEVRRHEPRLALDGGDDGLDLIRELVHSATELLAPSGALGIECAMGQAGRIAELMSADAYVDVECVRDFAGIERIVTGRTPSAPSVSWN